MIDQDMLHALLDYDPDTGEFHWIEARGRVKAGELAGYIHPAYGYRYIRINGTAYFAHRLAWLYEYGDLPEPPLELDHINNDKDDNRIANLRVVTRSQNQQNNPKPRTNTTGYKGVTTHYGRYCAQVMLNGRNIWLGYHDTPEAAAQARRKWERNNPHWLGQ